MPEAVVWVLSIAIPTLITTVVGVVAKKWLDKYYSKKEAEENKRFEEMKELEHYRDEEQRKEFVEIVEESVTKATKPIRDDLALLKKGNQASLRHNLYEIYDFWAPKGYCPRDVKVDFENLYLSYHNLGKNGVMDACYESLMALPDEKVAQSGKKKQSANILDNIGPDED